MEETGSGKVLVKIVRAGTSLVVQWLRLHAPNAAGIGSIPGQGTRSRKPQLRAACHNEDRIRRN